jgi:hypothetical protein
MSDNDNHDNNVDTLISCLPNGQYPARGVSYSVPAQSGHLSIGNSTVRSPNIARAITAAKRTVVLLVIQQRKLLSYKRFPRGEDNDNNLADIISAFVQATIRKHEIQANVRSVSRSPARIEVKS